MQFYRRLVYNSPFICPGGEIGRHPGLKILRFHERAGSIPAPGTIPKKKTCIILLQVFFWNKPLDKVRPCQGLEFKVFGG